MLSLLHHYNAPTSRIWTCSSKRWQSTVKASDCTAPQSSNTCMPSLMQNFKIDQQKFRLKTITIINTYNKIKNQRRNAERSYISNMKLRRRNVSLENELRRSRCNVHLVPRQTHMPRHLPIDCNFQHQPIQETWPHKHYQAQQSS